VKRQKTLPHCQLCVKNVWNAPGGQTKMFLNVRLQIVHCTRSDSADIPQNRQQEADFLGNFKGECQIMGITI